MHVESNNSTQKEYTEKLEVLRRIKIVYLHQGSLQQKNDSKAFLESEAGKKRLGRRSAWKWSKCGMPAEPGDQHPTEPKVKKTHKTDSETMRSFDSICKVIAHTPEYYWVGEGEEWCNIITVLYTGYVAVTDSDIYLTFFPTACSTNVSSPCRFM